WHLSSDPVGFDYWEVLPGQGSYYNPGFIQMDGTRKKFEGYCTDLITDKALDWLKACDKDKPFLLMCQHKAPHRAWAPHPRHFDMFPGEVPEPDSLFDDYGGRSKLLKENEMSIRDHFHWGHDMKFNGPPQFPKYFKGRHANGEYRRMTDEQKATWDAKYEPENKALIAKLKAGEMSDEEVVKWKYQRYIKDYLKCVAAVDDGVGRILDYLDQAGVSDNTIVIYSSDQGFYLGEHGWYDKRWMFEESLKMPFVIRWPGVLKAGTKSKALIQNIDYGPTFLDAAGVDVPAEMQGRSMKSLLANIEEPQDWRDAIYYAYYENQAVHNVPWHDGVRTQRYKLMYFPRTKEWQLFDLKEDPQEMDSRHDDPAYARILKGLKKRYNDLREHYDVNSATIPATRGYEDWWRQRDQQVRQRAKQGNVDLVFLGDSITQGWEGAGRPTWQEKYAGRKPLNLGFSGDRTEHVLWRLDHGNVDRIKPKVVVVNIGTNNTGHKMQDPAEVAEGIEKILSTLEDKCPTAKILLLGVFPRGQDAFDQGRLNNAAINQIIRRFDDGDRIHYRDIGHAFLEDDGTISKDTMPDFLHLSPEGYRRWAEAIEPELKNLGL
ncbi:MAG: sulfatase/phosphatase domain-containing protein, partial [Planctomycetota bacterium]